MTDRIDSTGLLLCRKQAEIFEASLTQVNCSSAVFLRRYMRSGFAARMDERTWPLESGSVKDVFMEIEKEFGPTEYGVIRYSAEELYWMGYICRYWSYTRDYTSKQIYKIIKPKDLRDLYFPFHSLDPANAIDRILEARGIAEKDFTAEGVKILRRIIQNRTQSRLLY